MALQPAFGRDTLAGTKVDPKVASKAASILASKAGKPRDRHVAKAAERRNDLGIAAWDAGHVREAIDHFRKAVALQPNNAQWHVNLAQVLLLDGDLLAGFRELEWMWPPENGLVWDGRWLRGEAVVLHHDAGQGFGDDIQFVRFAPLVAARGARVVIFVPPQLHRLFETIPGITAVYSQSRCRLPLRYYQLGLMRLPSVFGTTMETIPAHVPYFWADVAPWRSFLATLPGLKIGICWAGLSRTWDEDCVAMDERRSMRLADMIPLMSVPGCSWVSLQLGPPALQLGALPPGQVHDVSDRLGDWADTAGLVAGLDLVICVDTAVAHLAGALGKPVWMLNRWDTCWRWGRNRSDSPWYPTMRIFRQPWLGDWGAVIAEVVRELRNEAERL